MNAFVKSTPFFLMSHLTALIIKNVDIKLCVKPLLKRYDALCVVRIRR